MSKTWVAKVEIDFNCVDCGIDTKNEYYMVNCWPGIDGFLCIGCLETRLGRRLQKSDFTGASVNKIDHIHKSDRLKDRLIC